MLRNALPPIPTTSVTIRLYPAQQGTHTIGETLELIRPREKQTHASHLLIPGHTLIEWGLNEVAHAVEKLFPPLPPHFFGQVPIIKSV